MKPDIAVPDARHDPATERRAQDQRKVVPRAPAQHPICSLFWAAWISLLYFREVRAPMRHPLPNVTGHIADAVGRRSCREEAHGSSGADVRIPIVSSRWIRRLV